MFVVRCLLLFGVRCVLFVGDYLLAVRCCVFVVGCCVWCLLFVACLLLLLFVVCCLFDVCGLV